MVAGEGRDCVVLFSGGLDSTTVVAMATAKGFRVRALSFDYGQRHTIELRRAQRLALSMGCAEHRVLPLALGGLGGSALTTSAPVPKRKALADIGRTVPPTYVPARNTVFLAVALAWAETLGAFDIFFGANQVDYSGYPDCRPAFVEAFERLANLACAAPGRTGRPFRIHAPLMHMCKADIIRAGVALGVDYRATFSCYDPREELACGHCEACALRRAGFLTAQVADPTVYAPDTGEPKAAPLRPLRAVGRRA